MTNMAGPNPSGLCMCGCGEKTPLAPRTRPHRGYVKGQPCRFISGHPANSGVLWRGRKHGAESRRRMSASKQRDRGANWRGGAPSRRGYRKILIGKDHPMADANGYVWEHRLVAAASVGRFLARDEYVHHINEDKLDNRPENLVVVSRHQHGQIHSLIAAGVEPGCALDEVLG